jgi:hypothetical protein
MRKWLRFSARTDGEQGDMCAEAWFLKIVPGPEAAWGRVQAWEAWDGTLTLWRWELRGISQIIDE